MQKGSGTKKSKVEKTAVLVPPLASGDGTADQQEEIARIAHSYWEARGCPEGSPEEDWFRAEQEWTARKSAPKNSHGGRNLPTRKAAAGKKSRGASSAE